MTMRKPRALTLISPPPSPLPPCNAQKWPPKSLRRPVGMGLRDGWGPGGFSEQQDLCADLGLGEEFLDMLVIEADAA
jgi:hypothetical protein